LDFETEHTNLSGNVNFAIQTEKVIISKQDIEYNLFSPASCQTWFLFNLTQPQLKSASLSINDFCGFKTIFCEPNGFNAAFFVAHYSFSALLMSDYNVYSKKISKQIKQTLRSPMQILHKTCFMVNKCPTHHLGYPHAQCGPLYNNKSCEPDVNSLKHFVRIMNQNSPYYPH